MISLVLPAFNEVKRLENAVICTAKELKKLGRNFEIVIAEHGATDGTDKLAEKLAKKYPYVKHFHNDTKLGRGLALSKAFRVTRGDILMYADVDLATGPEYISKLVEQIENSADVSIGSRYLKGSDTKRSKRRMFLSKVFNFLVRLLLNSKIHDHQCGFKAFKRKTLLSLLDEVENTEWFWDTEILIRAQRKRLKVAEIPIRWYQRGEETKVEIISDSFKMFLSILKLMFS